MGRPKALLRDPTGVPWVQRAVDVLHAGGAGPILVALGAAADEARELVPRDATALLADGWQEGVGATLRSALASAERTSAAAALVTLVDLPDLSPAAVARVTVGADELVLRQAAYGGTPGHPVLIGRSHWSPLRAQLCGDVGARRYLVAHGVVDVECGDLGGGDDVDAPPGPGLAARPGEARAP